MDPVYVFFAPGLGVKRIKRARACVGELPTFDFNASQWFRPKAYVINTKMIIDPRAGRVHSTIDSEDRATVCVECSFLRHRGPAPCGADQRAPPSR